LTSVTKSDFLSHYENKNVSIEFTYDNVNITGIKDWETNKEIQEYVAKADNCYFITLEFSTVEIRLDK